MEDFAPSVIVKRDGVEVAIPMDEFWAMQEKEGPDEASAHGGGIMQPQLWN